MSVADVCLLAVVSGNLALTLWGMRKARPRLEDAVDRRIQRVRRVKELQALGLSEAQITAVLDPTDPGGAV